MKHLFIFIVGLYIPNLLSGQNIPDTNYVYSQEDSINGQIETAKRLKYYLDKKIYNQAINLFSDKQQQKIFEIKSNTEMFEFWIYAWTLTDDKLGRYISRIKRHKGHFVYEDNTWKIDEN